MTIGTTGDDDVPSRSAREETNKVCRPLVLDSSRRMNILLFSVTNIVFAYLSEPWVLVSPVNGANVRHILDIISNLLNSQTITQKKCVFH